MEKLLYELNEKVANFYHKQLNNYDEALKYLEARNINKNIIEELKIGYASDNNVIYEYLKEHNYTEDVILASGLIIKTEEGKIIDKYRNRIIFPNINEEGKIIAFGARTLEDNNKPKYINSAENLIYSKGNNLYGINIAKNYVEDNLIIVEGYIDFATLNQAGIKNVVALLGTAITEEQIKLIKKYTNNVILALDNDLSGITATSRVLYYFEDSDIEVKIIQLEGAKDPDEYIRKYGADKFKSLLDTSISPFEFKVNALLKEYNIDNVSDKVIVMKNVIQLLSQVKNEIEKRTYINIISKQFDIAEGVIYEELSKSL